MQTEEQRLTIEEATYAVQRLHDWADNEDGVSTFSKFLSLTGLMEQDGTVWATSLGYLEADLLAQALKAWATHPQDVASYLDDQSL